MRRILLSVVVLTTLLTGGCGIPDNSGVTVVGPPPANGPSVGDDGVPSVQYTRESTNDPSQLVD
jgi:hypothetical protein